MLLQSAGVSANGRGRISPIAPAEWVAGLAGTVGRVQLSRPRARLLPSVHGMGPVRVERKGTVCFAHQVRRG